METKKPKTKSAKAAKKAKAAGKAWVPEVGEAYYLPGINIFTGALVKKREWEADPADKANLEKGFACRTKAQALRKARAMIRAAMETK